MTRVEVFLLILRHQSERLFRRAHREGKSKELTPEFRVSSFCFTFYRPIEVFHESLCTMSPLRSLGSNHVAFGGMMLPESAMFIICCIETG